MTAAVAMVVGLLLGVVGLAVNNWMIRQEQLRTQDALNRAEQQKAIAQAVRDFLRNKLLLQADPRAQANALLKGGWQSDGRSNPTRRSANCSTAPPASWPRTRSRPSSLGSRSCRLKS